MDQAARDAAFLKSWDPARLDGPLRAIPFRRGPREGYRLVLGHRGRKVSCEVTTNDYQPYTAALARCDLENAMLTLAYYQQGGE